MSEFFRRIRDLDLAIVRRGDRWLVLHGEKVKHDCGSDTIAEMYLETLEEELLETRPEVAEARARKLRERGDADYFALRREASNRASAKANQRGGKGGRGGT
jgi:hypothetical protein